MSAIPLAVAIIILAALFAGLVRWALILAARQAERERINQSEQVQKFVKKWKLNV